ncbi:MAG TPA: tripartite tricarboxylate transporter TctB family protein [Thermodesulfobacteriota bacterium]|nr:tripartite tricarboxylate transporter TctB family protein [Thermodesulfobacteriota bacterium]
MPSRGADLATGVVVLALGGYVVRHALGLAYVYEYGPGPGFLPFWLGVGLLGVGALLVGQAVRRPAGAAARPAARAEGTGRALAAWAGIMAAIALMRPLGFVASFALLALFLLVVMSRRPLGPSLAATAVLAASFFALFRLALGLSLPAGPWGF